jgi:hypothetical protein
MALKEQPLSHPYLFFSQDDLPGLRARSQRQPYTACHRLILDTAEHILAQAPPPEPAAGPPTAKDEDGFLAEYLEAHYQFYTAAYALHYYVQVLAFAYLLSGDERYGRKARQWVVHFTEWQFWGPQAAPHGVQAAHCLLGTTLAYDWLGDLLTQDQRRLLQETMSLHITAFRQRWIAPPEDQIGATQHLDTSATWVCLAAAGTASLALLYADPAAAGWAEEWAQLLAQQVLPASFGDDGSFQEGTGWWDIYALRQGVLFMDALVHCGGPDLFADKNLRTYPHYLLQSTAAWNLERPPQTRCWANFQPPSPFHYRYVLLRLATAGAAADVFHAASRCALEVPLHTPLDWFYRQLHRVAYEPGRWYTVSLSWDIDQCTYTVGIDQHSWTIAVEGEWGAVDGVRFSCSGAGKGIHVRHLGVRPGVQPATALLEAAAELHVGNYIAAAEISAPHLHMPELCLDFSAEPKGTVWFQIHKGDIADCARIRLCRQGVPGPGLELAAVDLFPAAGADFLQCDSQGHTAPLNGYSGGQIWFDGPWEYLWYDEQLEARPPDPPQSRLFATTGLAYLRGAKAELRLRAGPALSKDRGDQNAFAIRLGDELMAGDLPQAAAGETALSQRQYDLDRYFLNTFACNTLLVNGNGQEVGGHERQWKNKLKQNHNGRIEHFFATPHFDAVESEAGNAYADLAGFRRRIAYIKPDYFVLADEVEAPSSVDIEWLFHTTQALQVEGNRAHVQGREHGLELVILIPDDALQNAQTPALLERERTQYARLHLRGEQLRILAVFIPLHGSGRPTFKPEYLSSRNGYGIHCVRGGASDLILFRAAAQDSLSLESVRSDASSVFIRRSGRSTPSLYAMVGGTHLSVRSELVRADRPLDLFAHRTAQRLNARVEAAAATQVRLVTGMPPRTVRLDGAELTADIYTYTPQGKCLTLEIPAGAHEIDINLK